VGGFISYAGKGERSVKGDQGVNTGRCPRKMANLGGGVDCKGRAKKAETPVRTVAQSGMVAEPLEYPHKKNRYKKQSRR